jgi:hypothetical protein
LNLLKEVMVESPTKLIFPKTFSTCLDEASSKSPEKFVFRAALNNKDEVEKWKKEYSLVSRTDWILQKSAEDCERYYYCRSEKL